jgi:hypothetical protein
MLVTTPAAAQTGATAAWQATPASLLKNTLRALTAAEARYHARHGSYSNSLDRLELRPEPGIAVQIPFATARGWHARATHRAQPGRSCVVFVGDLAGAEAPRTDGDGEMAGEEGVPLCDRMR